ncbi:RHS repeat-associated core domain-containing protein [Pseudomonas putida]|nr:RHS repeat-associated core domain-containing protein [Pseudomonas putida]
MQEVLSVVVEGRQRLPGKATTRLRGYAPYGYHFSHAAGNLGFAGELCMAIPGCYLLGNGARCYNSKLRRFSSPDGFSPFSLGGLNAYAYCGGNPVSYVDRNGHWAVAVPTIAKGLTAVWGAVAITSPLLKAFKGLVRSSAAWIKDKTLSTPVSKINRGANTAIFWGGTGSLSSKIAETAVSAAASSGSMGKTIVATAGGGSAMVAGVGKLVLTAKEFYSELETARALRLSTRELFVETLKEATGYNLVRGQEPPILRPRKETVLLVYPKFKDKQALGLEERM